MQIDIQKTKEYYQSNLEVCNCDACQNYIKSVAEAYPELITYLKSIGIDYKKPFETFWLEIEKIKQYTMKVYNILFLESGTKILCLRKQDIVFLVHQITQPQYYR